VIKLEPGDLEACDAAMRMEQAEEDYIRSQLRKSSMTDQEIEKEIKAKGLTAPRVTLAHIEGCIAYEYYVTGDQLPAITTAVLGVSYAQVPQQIDISPLACLTICVLVLRNGFTVTGESACASPENFNSELGRKIARQKAVEKIWSLEGYVLKSRLSGV
jgi:N4 Gp49/Sf6 Gp66 family protein